MKFLRSFPGILVSGLLVINLILTPILIGSILTFVEDGYKNQFIDKVRTSTDIWVTRISAKNIQTQKGEIEELIDDLLLNGQIVFADVKISNGELISSEHGYIPESLFNEDFYFSQNEDDTYYIAAPLINSYPGSARAILRLGYDEKLIQQQIDDTNIRVILFTTGYLLSTLILIALVAPLLTRSLRKLRDAAQKIASGSSEETFQIQTRISELDSLSQDLEWMRKELIEQGKQLQVSEYYIRSVMENMADAMIILDADMKIESINPAAEKIFGYEFNQIKNENIKILVAPAIRKNLKERFRNYLDKSSVTINKDETFEWQGQYKNGSLFPMELHVSEINIDRRPIYICSVHDITERKVYEKAIVEARNESEKANMAKSEFLSTMSHELRTPLNAIIGFSEIIHDDLDHMDPAEICEDLGKITRSGKYLLSLINNILDISKIEAGKMQTNFEVFNLYYLAMEIVDTIKPVMDQNKNKLIINCDPEIGEIDSDYTKLKQIIINLLSNSAKFTKNGTVTFTLKRELRPNNNCIYFSISDTGIGIRPDQIKKLFQPFSQANLHITQEYGGTGLGLAICKKFLELLGGEIDVESNYGEGSTFSVRILDSHADLKACQ